MRGLAKVIRLPDRGEEEEDLVKVRDVIRELARVLPRSVYKRHFNGEMWGAIEKHARRALGDIVRCQISSASYCEVELAQFCAAFLVNSVLQNLMREIEEKKGRSGKYSGYRFLEQSELNDARAAIGVIRDFVRQRLKVAFIPEPMPHILLDAKRFKR